MRESVSASTSTGFPVGLAVTMQDRHRSLPCWSSWLIARAGRGYDVEQREKVGLQDFAVGQAGGQRPRRVLADRTARVAARYRLASLADPAWLQAEKPGDLSPGELGVAHDECCMRPLFIRRASRMPPPATPGPRRPAD